MVGTGFMARAHSLAYTMLPYYVWPLEVFPRKYIIADLTPELAAEGAKRFGYELSTGRWQDVIGDPRVEIVDIVTPNHLHAEIAIAAARAGKHIICEKPLARNAEEAEAMVNAAKAAGVKTLVAYNYRRAPAVLEAKRLIDEGKIGKVFHFRGFYLQDFAIDPLLPLSWRFQAEKSGSGSLGDIGSHIISNPISFLRTFSPPCGSSFTSGWWARRNSSAVPSVGCGKM
jgi:predicted dehydrogenase